MSLQQLNETFSIRDCISFIEGKGGLPVISVSSDKASASISLYGGQVLSYQQVTDMNDLFFVSDHAYYEAGKAIKGGAPVCWPWFAANKGDPSLPFHGFVRNQLWQVESTELLQNGDVVVSLLFSTSEMTKTLWSHDFELHQQITIGEQLDIQLTTKNTGKQSFDITQAVHSYFNIGNINTVSVSGLEEKRYLDKVEQFSEKTQHGVITVSSEVDRIYQASDNEIVIDDPGFNRKIHINNTGSTTTVVWNPWVDISRSSADLKDDDYLRFICVETANAADEIITVTAGAQYTMGVSYRIENTMA